jgi:hypothetical protein
LKGFDSDTENFHIKYDEITKKCIDFYLGGQVLGSALCY